MSRVADTTYGGWMSFVDNWAQYHGVKMTETARDALANACINALGAEAAADYAADKAFRTAHPQYNQTVQENPQVDSTSQVQSIAKPARVVRRPAPQPAQASDAPPVRSTGRIVRRTPR